MNIIELVKSIVEAFSKISEICNEIHVDFTDESPTSYGLSSTGDTVLKEDILGNQTRQHAFTLYAVYQSMNDYDRMSNSGVLLELDYYLENCVSGQEVTSGGYTGTLSKLTCSNGMIYQIPNQINDGWIYQIQISAEYKIESEDI